MNLGSTKGSLSLKCLLGGFISSELYSTIASEGGNISEIDGVRFRVSRLILLNDSFPVCYLTSCWWGVRLWVDGGWYIPTANNISAILTFSLADDDVVVFVDLGVYGGKTSSLKFV